MLIPPTTRAIWNLLSPVQRRSAAGLFVLMMVGTVLETVGVGVIIPAMLLLTQGDIAHKYPLLAALLTPGGRSDPATLVVRGMLALVAVFAIKNAYLAFLAWRQNKFSFDLIESLSSRLFATYLQRPYAFHLQNNSALLIRNVVNEVDIFTSSVVKPVMQLIGESLVLVSLIGLVVWMEPIGAAIVAVITGLASVTYYALSHRHLVRWGELRQHHSGQRYRHLQQGLGGVKDVKLLGREADFLEQFAVHTAEYSRVGAAQNTLQEIPRLWLELLAAAGLSALVITMLARGRAIESVLPVLGVFAAAAFRLMPSLNRVLVAVQSLRFGLPVISVLRAELEGAEPAPAAGPTQPLPLERSLELDAVSFRYPGVDALTLPCVNVGIDRGSTVGFIGKSGAGKSTLVDLLLGLLTPQSGSVRVDGVDIQENLRGWQDQIGYVPQTIFLTDDTLRRNVAFGLPESAIDEARVWSAVRAAQLESFVRELPLGLETVVGERGVRLSGGQRQRIGIARALYHDPAVLVLDEATSSLDRATEEEVMKSVRALHGAKTVIIISHRISTVADCDRLYRLERGYVVEERRTAQGGSRGVATPS